MEENNELGIDFYFETDKNEYPIRQIEIWENGRILKYDTENFSDDYGFLADKPLKYEEFKDFEISQNNFEIVWRTK